MTFYALLLNLGPWDAPCQHRSYMPRKQKLSRHIKRIVKSERMEGPDRTDKINVRVAIPFDMECVNCGEQIPRGKKFYAVKGTSVTERYLGITVYIFEIRCYACRSFIGYKTDPKSGTYVVDYGCRKMNEINQDGAKVLKPRASELRTDGDVHGNDLDNLKRFAEECHLVDVEKLKKKLESGQ